MEIERRRRALGMTYRQLAKRSGVGLGTVHRVCKGNFDRVKLKRVNAILGALGIELKIKIVDQELFDTTPIFVGSFIER